MWATAKCKRCRYKWHEFWGSAASTAEGSLNFCPKCMASAIRRWFWGKTKSRGT
jgi:hypothetical protein